MFLTRAFGAFRVAGALRKLAGYAICSTRTQNIGLETRRIRNSSDSAKPRAFKILARGAALHTFADGCPERVGEFSGSAEVAVDGVAATGASQRTGFARRLTRRILIRACRDGTGDIQHKATMTIEMANQIHQLADLFANPGEDRKSGSKTHGTRNRNQETSNAEPSDLLTSIADQARVLAVE